MCSFQKMSNHVIWTIILRNILFFAQSGTLITSPYGKAILSEKWLWGSMKFEKSPSAHVCDSRFRLKCRETFPFVFVDRYDPKQAYKHTC